MKQSFVTTAVLCILLLGAAVTEMVVAAEAQTNTGRCVINVPPEWGQLKHVTEGYGFVFEDADGTLRTVSHMPCGFERAPQVALEIRRK